MYGSFEIPFSDEFASSGHMFQGTALEIVCIITFLTFVFRHQRIHLVVNGVWVFLLCVMRLRIFTNQFLEGRLYMSSSHAKA
jgi:hypothetical protein